MPSRRGMEQSLTWLRSKMAEKDTFDAINAEICYNVLMDVKRQKDRIGALYSQEREKNHKIENSLPHFYTELFKEEEE